jgi:RNA polymerase sigma factor (sigma-70 family)
MRSDDPLAGAEELLPRVYAYVGYRVRDRAEAEDITGETFARAVRYRGQYDPRRGEPIAWLLGIARRCIYDASLRPRPTGEESGPAVLDDFEADAVSRLTLTEALGQLSTSDRELLAFRYGADLSTREIARLLEMKPNAVDVALSRARSRLKELLEADWLGEPAPPPEVADEPL